MKSSKATSTRLCLRAKRYLTNILCKNKCFFKVTKAYSMLSSCLSGLKLELGHFQNIWKKYSEIWNVEREVILSIVFTLLVIRSTLPR